MTPMRNRRLKRERFLILGITFLAFGLRLWRLDSVPPGWRDDELINSLVISQKVLDGNWAVYYPDASGHEALYHALNAIMLKLFGASVLGIRFLSVLLGTLTVPVTWLVGRLLFGPRVGLVAAAALSISFWSLMYSRIGLRHILVPLLTAATVYFFWKGLTRSNECNPSVARRRFIWSAIFMALGFYTYFASRGLPLILLAFCGYLWLAEPPLFKRHRGSLLIMFLASAVLALPLLISLGRQPENEARVVELAVPVVEARAGNFKPLWDHIRITLNMFSGDGDGEWLYNIPHRPVFGPAGAVFFWVGVATAILSSLTALNKRLAASAFLRPFQKTHGAVPAATAAVFLLLWWLAGIAPAFLSVPPASLGHTILAQPAVFILAALPLGMFGKGDKPAQAAIGGYSQPIPLLLLLVLLSSIGLRDLPDYFVEWPQRGMVRFLYRADIRELAHYVSRQADMKDFSVSGLLAGPWDKIALSIDLTGHGSAAHPRWYDPRRAVILQPPLSFSGSPRVPAPYAGYFVPASGDFQVGEYRLSLVQGPHLNEDPVCFRNGLCSISAAYDEASGKLELGWEVSRPLDLPEFTLISNPPPPGVYAGPRLLVFGQLQDVQGQFLVGDDGLWVDPAELQVGDRFLQQHLLPLAVGMKAAAVAFGLYDPMTGQRILTEDGQDQVRISLGE